VKPKLMTASSRGWRSRSARAASAATSRSIDLKALEAFYGKAPAQPVAIVDKGFDPEPRGSNGFAIAPRLTAGGHALLMINPHTSFYFRPEIHMVSEEGLNAYGAVTWGQFFIYQGFNDRVGWMHTSGGGDVIDEYLETVVGATARFFYKYGAERTRRAREVHRAAVQDRERHGSRTVTAYFTHHGPVIREQDGKWVAVKMMDDPVHALMQSYGRTKARNYAAFLQGDGLRTNSSNNTVYADADGNIAYFHGNFIPRRDPRFDWTKPVDGSDPATEWKGLHA
jgi:acyl-homoserine-lactone acylase